MPLAINKTFFDALNLIAPVSTVELVLYYVMKMLHVPEKHVTFFQKNVYFE